MRLNIRSCYLLNYIARAAVRRKKFSCGSSICVRRKDNNDSTLDWYKMYKSQKYLKYIGLLSYFICIIDIIWYNI